MTLIERFALSQNTPYSKGKEYGWPGSGHEGWSILQGLLVFEEDQNFSVQSEFLFDEELEMNTEGWTADQILLSCLFYFLEEKIRVNKKRGYPLMSSFMWSIIIRLALSPTRSLKVLTFVRDLNLFKIAQPKEICKGTIDAFRVSNMIPFELVFQNQKAGLENVLFLLNINENNVNLLVNKAFEKQNLVEIFEFVKRKDVFLKINEEFLLNRKFPSYKEIQKDKKRFSDLEKAFIAFIEYKKGDLEEFKIFNIFESSELEKTHIDVLMGIDFFKTFYTNIKSNKKSYINIFLLFDNFVFLKDKEYKNIYDLNFEELHILVLDFVKKNEKELENIYQKEEKDLIFDKYNNLFTLKEYFSLVFLVLFSLFQNNYSIVKDRYSFQDLYPSTGVVLPVISRKVETNLTPAIERVEPQNVKRGFVRQPKKALVIKMDQGSKPYETELKRRGFQNARVNKDINGQHNYADTVSMYNDRKKFVKAYKEITPNPSTQTMHWDHSSQSFLWAAGNLSYIRGSAIARPQEIHDKLTRVEQVERPESCGYEKTKGSIITWVVFQGEMRKALIIDIYKKYPRLVDFYGLLLDDSLEAVNISIKIDIGLYKQIPIEEHLILPVNDCAQLLNQAAKECQAFTRKLMPGQTNRLNIKKATNLFVKEFPNTAQLYDFYHSLLPHLEPESYAYKMIKYEYSNFVNNADLTLKTLNDLGSEIPETCKNQLLNPKFEDNLSLEELDNLGIERYSLDQRKYGLKAIWYHSQNFERKE